MNEIAKRIEVNKAEEAKGRKVEVEAIKGRTDEIVEGSVGRKRESLESEDEAAEETAVVGGREREEADRPEYELRKRNTASRPLLPIKAEIDEHYPLHLNDRSWCKHSGRKS